MKPRPATATLTLFEAMIRLKSDALHHFTRGPDVRHAAVAVLALDDQVHVEHHVLERGEKAAPIHLALAHGHFLAPGAGCLGALRILDVYLADPRRGHM